MNLKISRIVAGSLLLMSLLSLSRCQFAEPGSEDVEWPPSLSTVVDKAPTIKFCELVSNPQIYNNKIVRTEAIFWGNQENEVLYSSECDEPRNSAWIEFDASYVYTDESIQKKLDEVLCPKTRCPFSTAHVTVVGRFEGPNEQGYGHLNGNRFRFSIMRVEQAEALTSSLNKP